MIVSGAQLSWINASAAALLLGRSRSARFTTTANTGYDIAYSGPLLQGASYAAERRTRSPARYSRHGRFVRSSSFQSRARAARVMVYLALPRRRKSLNTFRLVRRRLIAIMPK